jgi:hypothetical protein
MEIDFTKKKLLTENWLRTFGEWNKTFLKYVYGKDVNMTADLNAHKMLEEEEDDSNKLKFVIRGEQRDVQAYAKAILAEKEYLDAYIHFGEDHFQAKKKKEMLNQAVQSFEQTTGIRWPFKD